MPEDHSNRERHFSRQAVAVFARLPVPGKSKTRLIPLLGKQGAAALQAALLTDAVRKLRTFSSAGSSAGGPVTPYLFIADAPRWNTDPGASHDPEFRNTLSIVPQKGRDFTARLTHAFRYLWANHASAVVIGTDSPLLPVRLLRAALRELETGEAVLGPCPDGGYYLIGLRRPSRSRASLTAGVLEGVRWGSRFAFRDTLQNMLAEGLSCSILESAGDIDRPSDVRRLQRELAGSQAARRLAPETARFLLKRNVISRRRPACHSERRLHEPSGSPLCL